MNVITTSAVPFEVPFANPGAVYAYIDRIVSAGVQSAAALLSEAQEDLVTRLGMWVSR